MTGLPDPAERAAFFSTVQGKLISALAVIALVLGIAAEGVSLYRNVKETHTVAEVSINANLRQEAEADKAAEDARSAKAAADNAAALKLAEAQKAAADAETAKELAKKAAAEAETARAVAENAGKLKLAEAQKAAADAETSREIASNAGKLKLAEAQKAVADAETSRATADNAAKMKLAEARKTEAEANYQEWLNGVITGNKSGWHKDAEAATAPEAFGSNKPGWSREVDRRAGTMPQALGGGGAQPAQGFANLTEQSSNAFGYRSSEGAGSRVRDAAVAASDRAAGDSNLWFRQLTGRGDQNSEAPASPNETVTEAFEREIQAGRKLSGWSDWDDKAPTLNLRVKSEVSDGKLNLRNAPGRSHNIIAELPAGTVLRQVGACVQSDDGLTRDPWCKVDWNGTTGWASSGGLERYAGQ